VHLLYRLGGHFGHTLRLLELHRRRHAPIPGGQPQSGPGNQARWHGSDRQLHRSDSSHTWLTCADTACVSRFPTAGIRCTLKVPIQQGRASFDGICALPRPPAGSTKTFAMHYIPPTPANNGWTGTDRLRSSRIACQSSADLTDGGLPTLPVADRRSHTLIDPRGVVDKAAPTTSGPSHRKSPPTARYRGNPSRVLRCALSAALLPATGGAPTFCLGDPDFLRRELRRSLLLPMASTSGTSGTGY